ncbi:MAG: hypothetical protein KKD39_00125 [Candidatus Altiarchaeota archaeon]|nr:hypothetical protein [Candidatus Altiarchaeota archaeon]
MKGPYKIYPVSAQIGCKQNHIALSRICTYLKENGHTIVDAPVVANYIIINTCGFHELAEKRCVNIIKGFIENGNAKIISIGCLNKINKQLMNSFGSRVDVITDYCQLDTLFNNKVEFEDDKGHFINNEYNRLLKAGEYSLLMHFLIPLVKFFGFVFFRSQIFLSYFYAINLKKTQCVEINSGCTWNCSYCRIKLARGPVKSRTHEQIINDINQLVHPHNSILLVSDDCGGYGIDISSSLPRLLNELHACFPDCNFDLSYIHSRAKLYNISNDDIPIIVGNDKCSLRDGIHIDLYSFFKIKVAHQVYASR